MSESVKRYGVYETKEGSLRLNFHCFKKDMKFILADDYDRDIKALLVLLRFAHYGEEFPNCMEDGEPDPACSICAALKEGE